MEIQVLNKTEGQVWGTMVVSSSNEAPAKWNSCLCVFAHVPRKVDRK